MKRPTMQRLTMTAIALAVLATVGPVGPVGAATNDAPTAEPTAEPTLEPTAEPIAEPTLEPTLEPTAEPTDGAEPGAGDRVTYRGVGITVPEGWPVVDLAATPRACVRADTHAVYVGRPGEDQDCPSLVIGRVGTAVLQTAPADLPFGAVQLSPGRLPAPNADQRIAGEIVGVVVGTDVLLVVTLEPSGEVPDIGEITVDPAAATPRADPALAAANPIPLDRSVTWHYGEGFDACNAPSLATMQSWLASPYGSVGIYIGGIARACAAQPNLTASWLRSIAGLGWKVTPIYVGLQAPCSTYTNRITYGQEWQQGRDSALDAIARAQALGLGAGSDIYFDMESYPQGSQCSGSVRAFLSSWTSALHYNGYSSGVYSSAATGIEDLAIGFAQPGYVPPDKIWIARWNGTPDVYAHDAYVPDGLWSPYRRIHQYRGGHNETWGGVTINIDNDFLDTDPNRGTPSGRVDAVTTAPGSVTATGWALDPEAGAGPIIVQMYLDGAANTMTWANVPRPDVGSAFPAAGDDHGFSLSISAGTGPHTACLYAINVGPGSTRALGCATVVVPSPDPFGHVDSLATGPGTVTARGWAIDPNTADPILVQAYVDGAHAGTYRADAARADLGSAFPAAGAQHGFQATVPTSAGRHNVCVYAVNVGAGASTGLGCWVVDVPPRSPLGRVDAFRASPGTITAAGWALDPDTSGPIIVQMYVDASASTMAWAKDPRPDVGAAIPGAGDARGFTLSLAAPPGPHHVCVYAVNVGPGANVTLGCGAVTVPSADPFGAVDVVTRSGGTATVRGWAIDPDTSGPIIVQAYIGAQNWLAWANVARPDVATVFPAAGPDHGFVMDVPARAGDLVCLYAINTGPGAHAGLGCRTVP